jgi:hypothetical protein
MFCASQVVAGKMDVVRHHHAGHVLPCLAMGLAFEQTQAALKSVAEVLSDNNRGVVENNYRKSQSS